MDLPLTIDDLKEQLQEILPGCDFDVDEDTDEIIIRTNHREGANGDLEPIEKDDESGELPEADEDIFDPLDDEDTEDE